ncbi:MAG: tyrosine-type recombinase/integrase [Beijerinckiaceae bacterium]
MSHTEDTACCSEMSPEDEASNAAAIVPAGLLEPSFVDAIAAIEAAQDLSPMKKRHWVCSMRRVAEFMDRPLPLLPARHVAIRIALNELHHARFGVSKKTLDNHRANVRAAMAWLRAGKFSPARGAPLSKVWDEVKQSFGDRRTLSVLSGLSRYCSARGIEPDGMCEGVLDDYMAYREQATNLACGPGARRSIARQWNRLPVAVRSGISLQEPAIQRLGRVGWDDLPPKLQRDIDAYLALHSQVCRLGARRSAPWKDETLRVCRSKLVAAVGMAVQSRIPLDRLDSLAALVHPDISAVVIDAYWQKDGERPKTYTIDLGRLFLAIARETACLGEAEIRVLADMRRQLDTYSRRGLTQKNLKTIREIADPANYRLILQLPGRLKQEARDALHHAPVKAAISAQIGAAIGILCRAPIRLQNLAAIKVGENLVRYGRQSRYRLSFPDYDVKNRVDLDFELTEDLSHLIAEYLETFRPHLVRGSDAGWFFPGEGNLAKGKMVVGGQIARRIAKATGLSITVHQFRHIAAKVILDAQPGNYELARRVLGHKNISTTVNSYVGLETAQASKVFGEMVAGHLQGGASDD